MTEGELHETVVAEVVRRVQWIKNLKQLAPEFAAAVAGSMLSEAVVSASFQGVDVHALVDKALATKDSMISAIPGAR